MTRYVPRVDASTTGGMVDLAAYTPVDLSRLPASVVIDALSDEQTYAASLANLHARLPSLLRAASAPDEAWVGWIGPAAAVTGVHHEGGNDRPVNDAKPDRYARRVLLSRTTAERGHVVDRFLVHLSANQKRFKTSAFAI